MRAALGALGLFLCAQPLPDSVALAQPFWVAKRAASTPPQGPEVLAQKLVGDTFYAWVRFWEGPGPVQWHWGSDTHRTVTFVPPLPPDSLMPLADFSMPLPSDSEREAEAFTGEVLWIAVALLLLMILLGPFAGQFLRSGLRRLGLVLQWWIFLWRWRPRSGGDFRAFVGAVKEHLRAHAAFHPGALTPSEAQAIQGSPVLRDMLRQLLELEYTMEFAGKRYSPERCHAVWQAAWRVLRQVAPSLRKAPPWLSL